MRKNFLKQICSFILALVCISSTVLTATATDLPVKVDSSEVFHSVESVDTDIPVLSKTYTDILYLQDTATNKVKPVPFSFTTGIEKKSLKKQWRGTATIGLYNDTQWRISLYVQLWKDGHIYTTSSESVKDSALTVNTKYVSGTNKDQFGVHTDAIIKDDAGVVVYDNYLESGNPFE